MNIFISNLNYSVVESELQALFENYGEVESAKVISDRETGRSRGFGFVEMPNNDEALKAIEELNQQEFKQKVLNVSEARPKEDKPRSFGGNSGGGFNRGGGGGGYNKGGNDRKREW
ncbi:MAG: RNA-binding protein [Weeksellaceae bacterium]|jgi:RNA recognition motif-containing protein|nr:RNA-binding protein [Weeksellaceae bacterium]